jgi:potassium efflux system protein
VTVLAIIPLALMVLTATGYFYTTLRLSGRWIETVYLVIVWNLLYQTVLRGLSVAARRIAYRRAIARRQHQVKRAPKARSHRKSRPSRWSRLTSRRCASPCW